MDGFSFSTVLANHGASTTELPVRNGSIRTVYAPFADVRSVGDGLSNGENIRRKELSALRCLTTRLMVSTLKSNVISQHIAQIMWWQRYVFDKREVCDETGDEGVAWQLNVGKHIRLHLTLSLYQMQGYQAASQANPSKYTSPRARTSRITRAGKHYRLPILDLQATLGDFRPQHGKSSLEMGCFVIILSSIEEEFSQPCTTIPVVWTSECLCRSPPLRSLRNAKCPAQ